jgi:hypothetical protein
MKSLLKNIAIFAAASAAVFATAAAPASADELDRRVNFINRSNTTLTQLYVSNHDTGGWGEDQLGLSVIGAGEYYRLDVDDGSGQCRFDIKAVFADGHVNTRMNVNVCSVTDVTYFNQ